MISTTSRARFIASNCVLFILVALPAVFVSGSEWIGGDGNWFDQSNWDDGVPNMTTPAVVNSGVARFDQPATAGSDLQGLVVGGLPSTDGAFHTDGEVNGTATLTVYGLGEIGAASGTGLGIASEGEGRLILNGGDLISKSVIDPNSMVEVGGFSIAQASGTGTNTQFTARGEVQISNGSLLSEGEVLVGRSGGSGAEGSRTSHGSLSIMGGDLYARTRVAVGVSSGTGLTDGIANGFATITDGDLVVTPYGQGGFYSNSALSVGIAFGRGDFDASAYGELLVERGDIEAVWVEVGRAEGLSSSTARAHGRLTQRSGDLRMLMMTVGVRGLNGIEASGVFHLADGTVYGDSVGVGTEGTVILEIGAESPASGPSFDPSLPDHTPYGRLLADRVSIHGVLEARFTPNFTPQPGDSFHLIVTDSLTGDFDLQVTGLSPEEFAQLQIIQTPTLLRLHFPVPEPSTLVLVGLGATLLVVARRRSRRS